MKKKQQKGFAVMVKTAEGRRRQLKIAGKGGRAAHEQGAAHEWSPEEARDAGRKGGKASRGGRGKLRARMTA